MFARLSPLLSSFLIVFMCFRPAYGRLIAVARERGAQRTASPRGRGLRAQESVATPPPNPGGNPDLGFMFRLRAKSLHEKQTFVCTCM